MSVWPTHGSVCRASLTLFRAQSVVTRSMSELEAYLEVPLFERHANGMRLTDYGMRLLPRARRVLAELESVPALLSGGEKRAVEPLYLFQVRRLQVFVKLCETHHIQTVASLLGLSQPAISLTIKVMEDGCGQRLFECTPRGLQPTRASHEILYAIRRTLNELRHIGTDLSARWAASCKAWCTSVPGPGPYAHPARGHRATDGCTPGDPGDHQRKPVRSVGHRITHR